MLKNILLFIFVSNAFVCMSQRTVENSCNRDDAKEKCRKAITPYRYANMVTTDITYRRFAQIKEFSVPMYYDSKYRFVFNMEGLPSDIQVQIYDRHSTDKKREQIASFNSSEGTYTYDPEENAYGSIYVNYLIPASDSEDLKTIEKGCVVLMGGFENVLNFTGDGGESAATSE